MTLLFGTALLSPLTLAAQQVDEAMMLAPPPGPYVSSRPNLERGPSSESSGNRLPFIGNMPLTNSPMRYMPSPNQMPVPPRSWFGPMAR